MRWTERFASRVMSMEDAVRRVQAGRRLGVGLGVRLTELLIHLARAGQRSVDLLFAYNRPMLRPG